MHEYYIGLDISFTCTACIILDKEGELVFSKTIKSQKDDKKNNLERRILTIKNNLNFLKDYRENSILYTEDVIWGSIGAGSDQLAALEIYIRTMLHENGFKFETVHPSTLKKFVTGAGNAKKEIIIKEVFKRWAYDTNDNNLADAYALSRYAMFKDNEPKEIVFASKKKSYKKKNNYKRKKGGGKLIPPPQT